jgi:hypothetical protein
MILRVIIIHSKDLVYLLKDSCTRGRLLLLEVMAGKDQLVTCYKVDQETLTTVLNLIQTELKEMSNH